MVNQDAEETRVNDETSVDAAVRVGTERCETGMEHVTGEALVGYLGLVYYPLPLVLGS